MIKQARYKIISVPEYMTYIYPHCNEENKVGFSNFESMHKQKYHAWRGNSGVTLTCDSCNEKTELTYRYDE